MRALVLTMFGPQRKNVEITGTHWRFRMFMQAIGEIAERVDILHFLPSPVIAAMPDIEQLNAEQSDYLRISVSTHLIACQPNRRETFLNHYLAGILSPFDQYDFYWLCGAEQVAKVGVFLDQSPDIVFIHRLATMLPVLRLGRRPRRMFFDLDDVVHRVRFQSALQPPFRAGKLGYLCQIPAVAVAEWRGAALSRLTFVCSELDRSRLRRLGFPRIAVVPNALPVPPAPPELPATPTILFVGSFWYQPNTIAAEKLVRRIFPRVRAAVPEARLIIVGKGSLELPSRGDRPEGVEYLGYVEDLQAIYASTRVVCCPITSGSGTRLKLIEAAGYGRPSVATRLAAEGLDFRDGTEILLREDDDAIASACVQLMRDEALCRTLGAAARARMLEKSDSAVIRRGIVQMLSDACGGRALPT